MTVTPLHAPAAATFDEFGVFWDALPKGMRKAKKWVREKCYPRARRDASQETILDGLARYVLHKPDYADWCHASTFLNQGRWDDEYEEIHVKTGAELMAELDAEDAIRQTH